MKVMLAALVTISCLVSSHPSHAGGPPGPDVRVVNTTANPVPVVQQGTTSISGNVSITGTPNVNVANSPTVQVGNTPNVTVANSPTVQVGNDANHPVPVSVQDTAVSTPTNSVQVEFLAIDAGISKTQTLPTAITVRLLTLGTTDDVAVTLMSPGETPFVRGDGVVILQPHFDVFFPRLSDGAVVQFESPVPATQIRVRCLNIVPQCAAALVNLVGD